MKVSDYIVEFLIDKGVTDVFGYPGGMVTHLIDSFDKYSGSIKTHVNYHEQAASFCACGYAQVLGIPGCAYATSGPGATNLITGIANAYFDSIPCIFITGQVNTYEAKGELSVRQKGFQETDIVSIVKPITKYAVQVKDASLIRYELEKAYQISVSERPGPVVLDIPMDIQRADIQVDKVCNYSSDVIKPRDYDLELEQLYVLLNAAKRPVIIAGAGIRASGMINEFRHLVEMTGIPVVSSMIAVDVLPTVSPFRFGFIGAYGHRYANIILAKSDLVISIGSRLDCRQTGVNTELFAKNACVVRIDIDRGELTNLIKAGEHQLRVDIKHILPALCADERFVFKNRFTDWCLICNNIKTQLENLDNQMPNKLVRKLSEYFPENVVITTDVGQNQVWVAQSCLVKGGQRFLFSGGHGAMGYSLPAAIGAYYAIKQPVISFSGDGGLQMNIQELEFIAREEIPIKIILLNNRSLGMIRHFQEMYFKSNYVQTKNEKGYSVPNFERIVTAYGLSYTQVTDYSNEEELKLSLADDKPCFYEIELSDTTYIFPKVAVNKPIYDQEPPLDKAFLDSLMDL